MAKIGLQLYTVRELAKKDLMGTIRKVADAGYAGIEFDANMRDRADADALKTLMDGLDMDVVGVTVLMHQLDRQTLDDYIDYALTTGAEWLVMPWIDGDLRQDAAGYEKVGQALNGAAKRARDAGLGFQYHIHGFEFQSFGDRTGMEILLDSFNFDLIQIQVDTFWLVDAGLDLMGYTKTLLEANPGCIGSFHIKDAKSLDPLKDTEAGAGLLDVPGIVDLGLDQNIPWFIVEQEAFSMPVIESITASYENLQSLLKKEEPRA